MGSRLRRWACRLFCADCDCEGEPERLLRAVKLHETSVRAVEAAQRKQARRLSDVRIVVEATIRQMEQRAGEKLR